MFVNRLSRRSAGELRHAVAQADVRRGVHCAAAADVLAVEVCVEGHVDVLVL